MINKKAEIPLVILVLGVLLVCVLAVINFHFFSNEGNYKHMQEVVKMEQCLSYIEQYHFYKDSMGYDLGRIKNLPAFKEIITSENKLVCGSEGLKISYKLDIS